MIFFFFWQIAFFPIYLQSLLLEFIFIQATITKFEPFSFLESLTAMAMGKRERGDERERC